MRDIMVVEAIRGLCVVAVLEKTMHLETKTANSI